MCWSNKLFFIIIFLLALNSLLSGCGNKGELTLPEKNSPIPTGASKSESTSSNKSLTPTTPQQVY